MALEFNAACAMCGQEKTVKIDTNNFDGESPVKSSIEKTGWITQQNGPNFDIYCSKKCAA